MKFECDCCGCVVDVADVQDESILPPKNWRSIRTVIDVWEGDNKFNTWESDNVHSCDDCNIHMPPHEHIEAELEHRRLYMRQAADEKGHTTDD